MRINWPNFSRFQIFGGGDLEFPGRISARLYVWNNHRLMDCSSIVFKQKTAYEIGVRLVGSEMCIRDSPSVPSLSLSPFP